MRKRARVLRAKYPNADPFEIERTARLEALAFATGSSLSVDARPSTRRLVALEGAADRALAPLEAGRTGHGHDLARIVQLAHGKGGS